MVDILSMDGWVTARIEAKLIAIVSEILVSVMEFIAVLSHKDVVV